MTFSEFPWTQFSAIKQYSADIWYGFHILLIPFSLFTSTLGIKIAGVFLTFAVLYSLFFVLKKLDVIWPIFWAFLAFVSAPNIMNRLLMMRPHLLSLVLTILLFYYLTLNNKTDASIPRARSRSRYISIFIISALISWVHISLVWVPMLIFGIIFIIKRIIEKAWAWCDGLILLAGSLIGWLIRPNPIGAIKLAYIQVVELMIQKQQEATLLFEGKFFH